MNNTYDYNRNNVMSAFLPRVLQVSQTNKMYYI